MDVPKLTPITDAERLREMADAERLREMADAVERGDISEYVFVANNVGDKCFTSVASFTDRWRILGALEFAKAGIHNN